MEKENIQVETKNKRKVNWSLILIFFLLGFLFTLPGIMIKLLPAHSGRLIKFGSDVFILKNNGVIYHYKMQKEHLNLIEKFGKDDGKTYTNIEMLFTGSGVIVNKGDKIDIIKYNIETKKFEYNKTIELN